MLLLLISNTVKFKQLYKLMTSSILLYPKIKLSSLIALGAIKVEFN